VPLLVIEFTLFIYLKYPAVQFIKMAGIDSTGAQTILKVISTKAIYN
jgi:hypothetical protein